MYSPTSVHLNDRASSHFFPLICPSSKILHILAKEGAVVHLTALFGGIELYVPENVRIQITGTPIFGAWEDKTHLPASKNPDDPLLQINCTAVFGGIDIKN